MGPNPHDIQAGYDQAAEEYAREYFHELDHKPLDRQFLDAFINEVSVMQRDNEAARPACDMGCGPGEVAHYLVTHGLKRVVGVDLSPEMVRIARTLTPNVDFQVGDMLHLNMPDGAWAGIAAFYSIVHIPRIQVVDALKELKRVLAPGGVLLLSMHIHTGEDMVHVDQFYGKTVSMDWVFFGVEEMRGYLQQAGFTRIEVNERPPYPDVEFQGPRAYFFARKL